MGDGLALAILSARAAEEAIVAGRPLDYERARRRLAAGADWVSRWILRASRHPAIADRVVASLDRRREIFAALVGVASGARPRRDVSVADLVRLAV